MRTIKFSPPDISQEEIDEVIDTLRSGWITTGPKTKRLEKEISQFCDTNMTVCLNSATAAMYLTLHVLGIKPEDEIITSAYTYTASASVISHIGAKIVLCDINSNNLEMDYDKLNDLVNSKTKAIIPVDIAGIMVDYDKIFDIVEKKKHLFIPNNELQQSISRVAIIADAAHSFGAVRNHKANGSIADFTCFSFHAVKNFTTAEGGAVTWTSKHGIDDISLYRHFQLLSLHGQNKDAYAKNQNGSWEYDIIFPGYKCNMTDILASIGLAQMKRYPSLLEKRKGLIEKYNQQFLHTRIHPLNHVSSSGHLYIVKIEGIDICKRNEIIIEMERRGIACNVHYKPLPMLTAYRNLGFRIEDYPNSYDFFSRTITLPLHSLMNEDDVIYVSETLKDILGDCHE